MGLAGNLEEAAGERRVALLTQDDLAMAAATDGLNAGVQLLLGGESAGQHRHSPAALRIGLEGTGVVTTIDDDELPLLPGDVVLNPPGTWHGHSERDGRPSTWLDVVDLPLVSALGGVLFDPNLDQASPVLAPTSIPATVRFPWSDINTHLQAAAPDDGVRCHRYGGGAVLPTMAVTAYRIDPGSTLHLPARTCGAIAVVLDGVVDASHGRLERFDVLALRSWTPQRFTATGPSSTLLVVDTGPALRALGLYREQTTGRPL